MFELVLGVEHDPVVELVSDVHDAAERVGLVRVIAAIRFGIAREVPVVGLGVAADGDAAIHAVDLRRRRAESPVTLE